MSHFNLLYIILENTFKDISAHTKKLHEQKPQREMKVGNLRLGSWQLAVGVKTGIENKDFRTRNQNSVFICFQPLGRREAPCEVFWNSKCSENSAISVKPPCSLWLKRTLTETFNIV